MKAGLRDTLVVIEHKTATEDDYGGEEDTWTEFAQEYAEYKPGTGAERREAAQQQASLVATFRVLSNDKTRAVTPGEYRLSFEGTWDIRSSVRLGRDGIEITAVRAA